MGVDRAERRPEAQALLHIAVMASPPCHVLTPFNMREFMDAIYAAYDMPPPRRLSRLRRVLRFLRGG